MSLLILVVDDEPDVEVLFRQHFRRDLRAGRFTMEFAYSASAALDRITDAAEVSLILILSDINMPGMSGLELLPKAKALRPDNFEVPTILKQLPERDGELQYRIKSAVEEHERIALESELRAF
jgi:CheY-like chemotaxis protein